MPAEMCCEGEFNFCSLSQTWMRSPKLIFFYFLVTMEYQREHLKARWFRILQHRQTFQHFLPLHLP